MQRGCNQRQRSGLSLIDMLITIVGIAILIAILLPAVHQSRQSARRIGCSNNLRQVGLGLQSYHASFDEFPVGCDQWRGIDSTSKQLAWSAYLLPFIEQSSLFESINFDLPFDSPANAIAAATQIPVFRCPSSLRIESPDERFGFSDYGGIYGERISGPNSPAKGVMLIDVAIGEMDILDGLSNTLIVGEDARSDDGFWISGRNIFDQAFAINAGPSFENDIRSEHLGGANVCRCDGSVDFFSDAMDLELLAAACTRSGGELVSQ